jgi:basic membrane protein A
MRNQQLLTTLLLSVALMLPGCGAQLNCARRETFCIGLVTEAGRRDDRSYNQAAWEGVEQAKTEGSADWIASIETVDARDYEENIAVFADAGYDMIVTVGSVMGDATLAAAEEYPTIYFIGVDQSQPAEAETRPNLAGLVFPEDQLGFLAGALAALMTQSGKIGAVCVSDAWPPARLYGDGYRAGAVYIRPEATVTVVYHNEVDLSKSFDDPAWGEATADALIDQGADVIFGLEGTTGSQALVAAAKRGAFVVGTDIDQFYFLPLGVPTLLTSVVKLIPAGVLELARKARDAQAQAETYPAGNYTGKIGLAPYHDLDQLIPKEVKLRLAELNRALTSGEILTGVAGTNP